MGKAEIGRERGDHVGYLQRLCCSLLQQQIDDALIVELYLVLLRVNVHVHTTGVNLEMQHKDRMLLFV